MSSSNKSGFSGEVWLDIKDHTILEKSSEKGIGYSTSN